MASYHFVKRPRQMWHLLSRMEDHGISTLGSFPQSMYTVLTILFRKWNYYHSLFLTLQCSQMKPDPPEDVNWVHALLDSWGRNCLYMERILEVAIQWSRAPNQPQQCVALRLFALQEYNSTHHQPAVSSMYDLSDADDTIFTQSESYLPRGRWVTKHYMHTALKWWNELHGGSLIWLNAKPVSEKAALLHVHSVLDDGPPQYMEVS